MIEVKNIIYEYDGKKALNDINLNIKENERVVLFGNNGSGKSTFLRILAGLYFTKKGEYFFKNQKIKKKSINKEFRKKVGILFQNPESMIFNPTVFDEIAFSLTEFGFDNIEERVVEIAKKFNIEKFLQKSPLELSGGEKQKVMLAAIMVYEPELLLLDEPTAAMDPNTTGWFLDFIYDFKKTAIIATHDISLGYEMSDRAVVIDEKHRKIYDGDMEKLMGDLDTLVHANLIHKHKHKHKNFIHSHYHTHYE